jgi:hypothetical protein
MTSRKPGPHPYVNRLWKAAYARASFRYVKDVCDYILKEQIQPKDTFYPLMTAICVLYARPFKRSKGIESLTLQFVPKKFHYLHEELILSRDQMIAHVDAKGAQFKGLPANTVGVAVRDGQATFGVQEVKFKITTISQIRELASDLVERMNEYVDKLGSQYPNDVPQDGDYLIDLTTGTLRRL